MVDGGQTRGPGRGRTALIAVALVFGWLLHDLLIVAGSAGIDLALRIFGRSSLVAAAVAASGAILMRMGPRFSSVIGFLIAGSALAVTILRPAIDPAFTGLAKTVLLLALATAVLAWLDRLRWWLGLPAGFVVAAVATAARRLHWGPVSDRYLVMEAVLLVAGLVFLFGSLSSQLRIRRAAAASIAALVCAAVAAGAGYRARLPRADTSLPSSPASVSLPNLLLITLDTVRADHLAAYGYNRSTMPGLETVVTEAFDIYSQARSTSSWTLPSHGSLLTGLLPSEHGATHTRRPEGRESVAMKWSFASRLRDDVPTFAERLDEIGYRTGAIVANDGVLSHELGIDRGFAHYDDRSGGGLQCRQLLVQQLGWEPQFGCLPYRDATTVTSLALSWLRRDASGRPFFLFLNYMDAHEPYVPPRPFADAFEAERPFDRLKPPADLKSLQYDRELLYLDHELVRLLNRLKDDGVWDETVIVITSDHGEAFGEHGHWGHAQNLYEELLRVPLFVKGVAARRPSGRFDRPIGGHQVLGLTLQEHGFDLPQASPGQDDLIAEWYGSLAPTADRTLVSRDLLAWLDGSHKVIVGDDGTVEVYDLDRDPGELAEVALGEGETGAFVQRALAHWSSRSSDGGAADLSPETMSRLRALGYLPSAGNGTP